MSGCTPMPVCARMSGNADVGVYPDVGVRDKICDRPRDKRVTKIGAVCDGIVVRHNRVASGGPKGVRDTVRDRVGDEARDKRVTKNRAMFCGCLRSFFCHASVGPFVTHMAGAPENNLKSNVSCTRWVCLSRTCWGGCFVTHTLWGSVCHAHAGGFCHPHALGSTRPLENKWQLTQTTETQGRWADLGKSPR